MKDIFDLVEKETGVTKEKLIVEGRHKETVLARALFVEVALKKGYSYPATGRALNRDHTTVMHSHQKHKDSPWIIEVLQRNERVFTGTVRLTIKLSGRYGQLITKFDGKCAVCGFDEIVEVHHITPRHRGGQDNPENLIVLCPNHHALADKGMLNIKDIHIKL